MLEEVRESRLARPLVGGAGVVPDVHRDEWELVVLVENDLETVRERVLLELQLDLRRFRRFPDGGASRAAQEKERGGRGHAGGARQRTDRPPARRGDWVIHAFY